MHPRVLDLLTLLYDHDILKKMAAQANFDIDEIKEKGTYMSFHFKR